MLKADHLPMGDGCGIRLRDQMPREREMPPRTRHGTVYGIALPLGAAGSNKMLSAHNRLLFFSSDARSGRVEGRFSTTCGRAEGGGRSMVKESRRTRGSFG